MTSNWKKFGTLIIRESSIAQEEELHAITVDHAFFVSGWEDRALHSTKIINFEFAQVEEKTPNITILNFDLEDEPRLTSETQIFHYKSIGNCKTLSLKDAYKYSENINLLKNYLRKLKSTSINSIYFDITTLPKYYIQALTKFMIIEDIFSKFIFGYSPGIYSSSDFGVQKTNMVDFPVIDTFRTSVPIREKQLTIVLGGERSNCYSLISKIGPDRIDLFQTNSTDHPDFARNNEIQIQKISSEHGDKIGSTTTVDAFSVTDFMEKYNASDYSINEQFSRCVFVASTKVLALGSGLLGASLSQYAEVRARISGTRTYPNRLPSGKHFLFEVAALNSPKLDGASLWANDM